MLDALMSKGRLQGQWPDMSLEQTATPAPTNSPIRCSRSPFAYESPPTARKDIFPLSKSILFLRCTLNPTGVFSPDGVILIDSPHLFKP